MLDFLLATLVGIGLFVYIFKSKRFEEPIYKRKNFNDNIEEYDDKSDGYRNGHSGFGFYQGDYRVDSDEY
ncbi:hypothetical protein [Actinobacillus pleuropneumoniae]|uniref:hypothetical protein n=1 Tax=Actinobacillus pleuropneumoniae TaxID=715 RepID=UPI003B01304C